MLLRESIGDGELHTTLLLHYVTQILHPAGAPPGPATRAADLRRVTRTYLATGRFFRVVFAHEAGLSDEGAEGVLEIVYEGWRRREGEGAAARATWRDWLVGHGQGRRAAEMLRATRESGCCE